MDLLFELHSSILKPNFDLSFGKAKLVGHFDPSSPCEVVICVKFLLQLQGLISGVCLFDSPPEGIVGIEKICTRIWTAWNFTKKMINILFPVCFFSFVTGYFDLDRCIILFVKLNCNKLFIYLISVDKNQTKNQFLQVWAIDKIMHPSN
jgi:hypothetical protein